MTSGLLIEINYKGSALLITVLFLQSQTSTHTSFVAHDESIKTIFKTRITLHAYILVINLRS